MAKKKKTKAKARTRRRPKQLAARMEDPKANARPDLAYGGSSLSVDIEIDTDEHPQKLTVMVEIELPEATEARRLHQDLLAACRIADVSAKYLQDRGDFFREQIRRRLNTKGCKQEPGFLTGTVTPQSKRVWDWKEYAILQSAKLIRLKEKCSMKKALVLAAAKAAEEQEKAPIKKFDAEGNLIKDAVSVRGVILDS